MKHMGNHKWKQHNKDNKLLIFKNNLKYSVRIKDAQLNALVNEIRFTDRFLLQLE